ncbi:hypothetical protein F4679DRAFT_559292 [Xylaria curta]|nr:hypothetical protein F4679DRAFT_559292 [Xylaria curta]
MPHSSFYHWRCLSLNLSWPPSRALRLSNRIINHYSTSLCVYRLICNREAFLQYCVNFIAPRIKSSKVYYAGCSE